MARYVRKNYSSVVVFIQAQSVQVLNQLLVQVRQLSNIGGGDSVWCDVV